MQLFSFFNKYKKLFWGLKSKLFTYAAEFNVVVSFNKYCYESICIEASKCIENKYIWNKYILE